MLTRRRIFTVFLAVAALAAANCVAPQIVLAGHHGPSSKMQESIDLASHGHAGQGHDHAGIHAAGQDAGTTNDDSGAGGPSKFCCTTMTCTAGAVLTMAPVTPVQPLMARAITAALDDMLWAFNVAAIDPPPRVS